MTMDFEKDLNPAQLEAVLHDGGPLLVIAGAGSGKTRTIVYRLARLIRSGVSQDSILLLTFTRKAAQEMVLRAGRLLSEDLARTHGGTFHSFAFSVLRQYPVELGFDNGFTVMDRADSENVIKAAKDDLQVGKGVRSFPKKSTIMGLVSKSRNKEVDLEHLLTGETFHLSPYADDLERIGHRYEELKNRHGLVDYDDLLFLLERLLRNNPDILERYRRRFSHLMVDEYQDTNLVQARLVRLLAGEEGRVMAVGDDAQSIYAFRGATVSNILDFPKNYTNTKIVRLEQNYRSTQPILDLTNHILDNARDKFDKRLFTENIHGQQPRLIHAFTDQSQAERVVGLVAELRRNYPLREVAVLFRAGYQSYPLEIALERVRVPYQKFGGVKFHEAAHIKDALSYLRLAANPGDLTSWQRAMAPIRGVGPKTCSAIVEAMLNGDSDKVATHRKKKPELDELFNFLTSLRERAPRPREMLDDVLAFYDPILRDRYADDYPIRQRGLEELLQISGQYNNLDDFLADLSLDPREEDAAGNGDALTLSTMHSAKGLEWSAVIVIDLVEDRFPTKRALSNPDDLEEERRLFYVACTRAREELHLFIPAAISNRYSRTSEPVRPSPFVLELPPSTYEPWKETYSGTLSRTRTGVEIHPDSTVSAPPHGETSDDESSAVAPSPDNAAVLSYCRHKIFGRGKIVAHIEPDKYRVNFPGFGLKVILGDYLEIID